MLLDEARLLQRVANDRELLEIIARQFLDLSPQWLQTLRRAIEQTDASLLYRTAHTLKGSLGYFTESTPYQLAFDLEQLGKAGTLAGASQRLADLERATAQLCVEIAALLHR